MLEQVIGAFAKPVLRTPETRYVNGETRYMKIQKRGSRFGPMRTLFESVYLHSLTVLRETYPQNMSESMNRRLA